jgi:hypothetical protein
MIETISASEHADMLGITKRTIRDLKTLASSSGRQDFVLVAWSASTANICAIWRQVGGGDAAIHRRPRAAILRAPTSHVVLPPLEC